MPASKKARGRPAKLPVSLRKNSNALCTVSDPKTQEPPIPVSRPRPKPLFTTTETSNLRADHAEASNDSQLLESSTVAELEAGRALVALLQGGGNNEMWLSGTEKEDTVTLEKDLGAMVEDPGEMGLEDEEEAEDESIPEVPGMCQFLLRVSCAGDKMQSGTYCSVSLQGQRPLTCSNYPQMQLGQLRSIK